MRILISSFIRQAGVFLIAFSTKIEDIPKILQLLVDFLKKEPKENYSKSFFEDLEVPLTLSPEAVARFKTFTEEYPSIYIGGQFWDKLKAPFNLIIVIGQVLTKITMPLEELIRRGDKKELEAKVHSLYHLWDGLNGMSARSLVNIYKNKSTGDAKKALISKLEASINVAKEIINLQ